jgi:hypothetical protein
MATRHSINTTVTEQQQADSVLQYVGKYGQYLDMIWIWGAYREGSLCLRQLLPDLKLSRFLLSVTLSSLCLQLQPSEGFQGVLAPLVKSSALKQFRLLDFELPWDGDAVGLAAALTQLPAGL